MRASAIAIMALILIGSAVVSANDKAGESPTRFAAGAAIGYSGGFAVQLNGLLTDFADGFPLQLRGGVGYARVEPGRAVDARRIFINDATNGVPVKSGRQWELSFDFLYPLELFSLERTYLALGPRHVRFTGNFKYVGGNEDFDVTSQQWGMGAGLTTYYRMGQRTDLVLGVGLEHFFKARLSGHDTSYSPDGDHTNPRNDYDWSTADDAIDQPKQVANMTIGLSYRL